ncbi:fungal-specific transcription factor domain-containing protein [Mycena albidolilacea]|uniref:Fungal-specific transcription factor domain-containing protein n=1 Tax=Mycena albidolilacea TaxID=1033008 RepID=A0AAD7A4U8_9AGAR|nr:fungal-specific transcription factor domain-containing protein [Mycena albidolilacea]
MANDELETTHRPASPNFTRAETGRPRERRPHRSCDICRQRKTRCDGAKTGNGRCSNCLAFGSSCTYAEAPRKRGPKNVTIEDLKKENEALKAKLRSLSLCSLCSQPLQSLPAQGSGSSRSGSVVREGTPRSDRSITPSHSGEPPDEHDFTGDDLAAQLERFSMKSGKPAFFGPASSFGLANNAIAIKEKYLGRPVSALPRRPLFWGRLPWEEEMFDRQTNYNFPDRDLIASLLDLYFTSVHPTIPILHRPTFEKYVAEGLYFTDREFGGTLLSVLAVASRYSNDPRVFVAGDSSLSSGWPFFVQIRILQKMFEPTIHEVQMYCLLALFILGTSVPQVSWLYIGLGIRFLQQRGEHRRKRGSQKPDAGDELWKRAFWSFVLLERISCLFLGRPMGMHVEEYDIELPLDVDDEYWDTGFVQPVGQPSQLAYFVCHLRLSEILADAMRRLYGSKKSKILLGWDGPDWEQRAVADLDSAMNDFVDSIPLHLRWDPENPPQGPFFDQAAILHISYNHILIAIHRPYIQKAGAHGAPSLSICARAARGILHTARIWLDKLHRVPLPGLINPVFVSCVILIVYMLGTKRAGLPIHKNKDLAHIATAMEILKVAESRMQPIGRLWEKLRDIWSLDGSLPLEHPPHEQVNPGDSVECTTRSPDFPPPASAEVSGHSLSDLPHEYYYPQPPQPIDYLEKTLPSTQSHSLEPGMSIEQLLGNRDPFDGMEGILDDELMSMWMAAPTDIASMGDWNADIENRNPNGVDGNWFGFATL